MRDDGASTALAAPREAELVAEASEGDGDRREPASSEVVRAKNPSFHPGALIADKYVVERLIGEGGLGVVVAARHVQLDQMVAIKYLRPRALASPALAEDFVREARLATRIRSEHVARVYDVGTLPSGAPYIVMEYLSGMDLGRVLAATGPMPVWRAVEYVLQACSALGAAHAAGIVHRDIKPENLFVTTAPNGAPLLKVLDFGISKVTTPRLGAGPPGEGAQPAVSFGTPVYMSPEQLLASGDVDARTDVWAIGVVLYQLLAARLPFDGDSLLELSTAIMSKRARPLDEVRKDLPADLLRAVATCLAKAQGDRFQSVADLGRVLAPFAVATREQRVDQALRTVDAADRGRPATPVPDELLTRALRAAPVPSFPEQRWAATTSSGVSSWAPPAPGPEPRQASRLRARGLALVAATVAAGAVAVLVATAAGAPDDKASGDRALTGPSEATLGLEPPQAPVARAIRPVAGGESAGVEEAPLLAPVPPPPPVATPPEASAGTAAAAPARAPVPARRPAAGRASKPARASEEAPAAAPSTRAEPPPGASAPTSPVPAAPASAAPAADPNTVLNPFD